MDVAAGAREEEDMVWLFRFWFVGLVGCFVGGVGEGRGKREGVCLKWW